MSDDELVNQLVRAAEFGRVVMANGCATYPERDKAYDEVLATITSLRAENEDLKTTNRYGKDDWYALFKIEQHVESLNEITEIYTLRLEIAEMRAEVDKYKQWFTENGGVLAAHRIGGCYFGENKP